MVESAYAAAPFDHAKADIILRSSDNVDFRVFKLFLSLASPFFETLFEIPQPAEPNRDQEVKDGLVVIPIAEDSKTLDALLRFCYPCTLAEDPHLVVLKDALEVLEAAKKYSLDAMEKKACQAIANPQILEEGPLRCFAVAYRGRLRKETLLAAKYTLRLPLIPPSFPEIDLIAASDLLTLLTYHQRCGDAVYALQGDLSWITSHYGSAAACNWLSGQTSQYRITMYNNRSGFELSSLPQPQPQPQPQPELEIRNCRCQRVAANPKFGLFNYQPLQWWEDFMKDTFAGLRDRPCEATVRAAAEKTVNAVKAKNCSTCARTVTEGMRDFSDLLVRKVEETVSLVTLELSF